MNRYQFVSNNQSSKNTNFKSDIHKLSTNKRCHFLEIIVHINEISEHLHSNSVVHTWYTSVTAENWRRPATHIRTLESLVHNWIWNVTAGRKYYLDPKQPGTQLTHCRYLKSDRGKQLVHPGLLELSCRLFLSSKLQRNNAPSVLNFSLVHKNFRAHSGAVSWGTALQARRSRFRFPMVSLEFFIGIIPPAALWPWGWLSL
jgi:hypothetical protein